MTVNYTTNLALGQPVTGTESGTWGDDVNNAVTSYLDIAIAGGLAITVTTADVTLTLTQGTSSATNIGSTTAQYAIINVTGAKTAARNLIVPSSSRHYIINNAGTSTGGPFLLTVKGAATTGITLVDGEKAIVAWNGTDYVKIVSSAIATASANGYLSSTDWTTFNGKAASGANADITSMTALTSVSLPSAATTSAITITGRPVTGIGTVGGAVSLTGGIGSSNSTVNGNGGAVNITGGAGGSTSSASGGTGGGVSIVGGAASTTNSNTLGGAVTIAAGASSVSGQFGAGVTISSSAGFAGISNATGGSVTINGGSGGSTGTTGTGGSITINSGAGTGSAGQAGSINFNLGATTSAQGTVNFQQGTTTKASIDSSGNVFTGAATATLPTNSGTVSTGTQFGFKNKLINGNYIISNNTAGSSGGGSGNTFNYTIDRWIAGSSNNATVSFSTSIGVSLGTSPWPAPTAPTVIITNTASSTGTLLFAQRIEANNIADLYSDNVTFSLYCATSGSSTVTWTTYYANTANTWAAAGFGTTGSISANATQIATGTFTTTTSLAYKTVTTNIGTNAFSNGLMIVFSVVSAAASSTVTFGPVQMEKGSIPTPFEFRAFGTELALCQRYYEVVGAQVLNTVPTAPYNGVPYRVQKRAVPSISYSQVSGSGAVFSATSYVISSNPYIYQSTASSGSNQGYVNISAEL